MKNITVQMPRNKMVFSQVFPVQGNLRWHSILFAPRGSVRYVESLICLRAPFLEYHAEAGCDEIVGLSPAIFDSIRNPRAAIRVDGRHGHRNL